MKRQHRFEIPKTPFQPINKFLKTAENYLKARRVSLTHQDSYSADVCLNGLLRQIEKLGKINADVWGPGFAEARETAYEILWEMVGEVQLAQHPRAWDSYDSKGNTDKTVLVGGSNGNGDLVEEEARQYRRRMGLVSPFKTEDDDR